MKRNKTNLGIVGIILFVLSSIVLQPSLVAASAGSPTSPLAPPGCEAAGNCSFGGSTEAQKYCGNSDTIDTQAFVPCNKGYDGAKAGKSFAQACKAYIGHTGTAACTEGYSQVKFSTITAGGIEWQAICEKLKTIKGESLSKANCSDAVLSSQDKLNSATKAICDKYGKQELATECEKFVNVTGQTTDNTAVKCEDTGGNLGEVLSLSWVICPVFDGISSAAQGLDKFIYDLLAIGSPDGTTDPNEVFCNSSTAKGAAKDNCQAYHAAWVSFRNIALGFLVIIALIIVISQALGSEFVDAYTIKKTLPRLVAIAIAITLSWTIMQIAVQISNDLGYGVSYIIGKPFQDAGINQFSLGTTGGFAIELIGAISIASMGIFGLLSFALTALIAVFVAFLVIVIREIVVIMLVIIAPIALVTYILPNTQRFYKMWSDAFLRALMMFPLIAGLITVGRVFSSVANDGNGTVGQLLAFVAYFAPYFMLPLTFQFAGSAISGIGNFANSKSQGARDGLKQFRGKKRAENWQKTKDFSRFSGNNRVGRSLNNIGGALSNPGSMRLIKNRGLHGVRQTRQAGQAAHGAEALKNSKIAQANMGDDNFLMALSDKETAQSKIDAARTKSQDMSLSANKRSEAQQDMLARQRGMDAVNQMGGDANSLGVRTAAFQELNKTGYQWSAGEEGYKEMEHVASKLSGGDERTRTALMDTAQYHQRSSGQRYDLAGINHGAGYDPGSGTDKASLYALANAKPASINGFMEKLQHGPVGHEHAVAYKELEAMSSNATGATKTKIDESMRDLESRGIGGYMNMPDPGGSSREVRVNYDAANQAHAGWSNAEKDRGWRAERRAVTRGDIATQQSRSYERPDPNNIP